MNGTSTPYPRAGPGRVRETAVTAAFQWRRNNRSSGVTRGGVVARGRGGRAGVGVTRGRGSCGGGAAARVEQGLGGPDGHLGDAANVAAVLDGGGDQLA